MMEAEIGLNFITICCEHFIQSMTIKSRDYLAILNRNYRLKCGINLKDYALCTVWENVRRGCFNKRNGNFLLKFNFKIKSTLTDFKLMI